MSRPQHTDPGMASDLYARGRAALLQSRHGEAQELLEAALAAEPEHPQARRDLAWAYYRDNDFASASDAFDRSGASAAMVSKLRSFGDEPPYQLAGAQTATLPFLITDPLPVVRVDVEGREVCVLLDTGGAELILDAEFAREIGIRKKPPFRPGRISDLGRANRTCSVSSGRTAFPRVIWNLTRMR